jgi:hypothetical protein
MSMFSTRYALSDGIKEFTPAKEFSDGSYVYDGPYVALKIGKEAFHTLSEAVADAEKRRVKKIASLQKQIKALESMKFIVGGASA